MVWMVIHEEGEMGGREQHGVGRKGERLMVL